MVLFYCSTRFLRMRGGRARWDELMKTLHWSSVHWHTKLFTLQVPVDGGSHQGSGEIRPGLGQASQVLPFGFIL